MFSASRSVGRSLSDFVKPLIEGLRPIPPIAWTPIAILWFGIGNAPGYFLVFVGAVFPVFVNTFAAVRNIDRNQINAALCLGAGQGLSSPTCCCPPRCRHLSGPAYRARRRLDVRGGRGADRGAIRPRLRSKTIAC